MDSPDEKGASKSVTASDEFERVVLLDRRRFPAGAGADAIDLPADVNYLTVMELLDSLPGESTDAGPPFVLMSDGAANDEGVFQTGGVEIHPADAAYVDAQLAGDPTRDGARVVIQTADGKAISHTWDGSGWGEARSVVEADVGALGTRYDDGGEGWIALNDANGSMILFRTDTGQTWEPAPTPVVDSKADKVALLPLDGDEGLRHLLVWASPGTADSIFYVFVSSDGSLLNEVAEVPLPVEGIVQRLELSRLDGGGDFVASVTFQIGDGTQTVLGRKLLSLTQEPATPQTEPGDASPAADGRAGLDAASAESTASGSEQNTDVGSAVGRMRVPNPAGSHGCSC